MIDGHEPGDAGFTLTVENTPAVRAWLVSEGLDPARVEGMRNDSLAKAYRYPAYLRQMKTRADYYPSCAKPKENTPCEHGSRVNSTSIAPAEPTPAEPMNSLSKPDQQAGTSSDIDQPALTEARVVELIEEHAIRVIMERLQLGELLK